MGRGPQAQPQRPVTPSLWPSRVTLRPQNSHAVLSVTLPVNLFLQLERTQHELKCKGVPEEMKTVDPNLLFFTEALKCLLLSPPGPLRPEAAGTPAVVFPTRGCHLEAQPSYLPKEHCLSTTFRPKRLSLGLRIKFIFHSQSSGCLFTQTAARCKP